MNKNKVLLSLLVLFVLAFSACGPNKTGLRTATFTSLENDVQARSSDLGTFSVAAIGQVLEIGGEVKTGESGKALLSIQPEDTSVYIGPNTEFTLTALDQSAENPFSSLSLDHGNLWIVLNGGSLDVETPVGVASVRGSLMGVGFNDGLTTVTCLEGHCDLTTDGGNDNLTGGQACDLDLQDPACQKRELTEQEQQTWEENVPGAGDYLQPIATFTPTITPTPQPLGGNPNSGPQLGDFPPGINPLTGLPVTDPALLQLPAIMISIPHFPASARPQAGLSFAPWIFEIYIGEGMTRFLTTFYGEMPEVKPQLSGTCEVRVQPFESGNITLGNRAWFDKNGNGYPGPGRAGNWRDLRHIIRCFRELFTDNLHRHERLLWIQH